MSNNRTATTGFPGAIPNRIPAMRNPRLVLCIACSLPVILLLIVLAGPGCRSANNAIPIYVIDGAHGEIVVTEVSVSECEFDPILSNFAGSYRDSVSKFRRLTNEELVLLRPPKPAKSSQRLTADRELIFDFWKAAELLKLDSSGAAIQSTFKIDSVADQEIYIGVGADDREVLYVNDKPVFGVVGNRENVLTHHMAPIALKKGPNIVTLVAQRNETWYAIPDNHSTLEWAGNIQIFPSKEVAWDTYCHRTFHPFEIPIIASLELLRSGNCIQGKENVTLYDLDGKAISTGKISTVGVVTWESPASLPSLPFIGVAEVGNGLGEVIIATGNEDIGAICKRFNSSQKNSDGEAWTLRLSHLLSPEFFSQRKDVSWAQKVALAVAKMQQPKALDPRAPLYASCPSTRIEFGEYRSHVDGTKQYYRFFNSRKNDNRAVAMVVAGVQTPVRPYLESPSVADISGTERLASIADSKGIDLLWCGNSNTDYGGDQSVNDISEALTNWRDRNGRNQPSKLYVVGNCSGAVPALNFSAASNEIAGIVLWSPTVNRRVSRWFSGLDVDECTLSEASLEKEQTYSRFERYCEFPVFMYYDTDIEGHGDRAEAEEFMHKLSSAGGHGTSFWLENPDRTFMWGIREVASERQWMDWIADCLKSPSGCPSARPKDNAVRKITTVKEALLGGFVLNQEDLNNRSFSMWAQNWSRILAAYRGSSPDLIRKSEQSLTVIRQKTFDDTVSEEIRLGTFCDGMRHHPTGKISDEPTRTPIWGYRLTSSASGIPAVEILTDPKSPGEFPKLDLIAEGSCRAAIFTKVDGRWTLLDLWL